MSSDPEKKRYGKSTAMTLRDSYKELSITPVAFDELAGYFAAVYWRQYSAGVDGQAISYYAEHPKELE